LTRNREKAIRLAVESAPEHVAREDGFLAQIVALERIVASDSKLLLLVLLIDVTAFGFELAAVMGKGDQLRSHDVRTDPRSRLLHDAIRVADEMTVELQAAGRMPAVAGCRPSTPAPDETANSSPGCRRSVSAVAAQAPAPPDAAQTPVNKEGPKWWRAAASPTRVIRQ